MTRYSNILTSLITPIEAVEMTHGTVRTADGTVLSSCPACGRDMALIHRSFFCSTTGCQFSVGSIVDYLVMRQDVKSYADVVGKLMRAFADRLVPHMDMTDEVTNATTQQLRRGRRVLDFVLRAFGGLSTAKWQQIRSAANPWQLGACADRTLMYLDAGQVEELASLLRDAYPDAELGRLKFQPMLVLPWFSDHHQLVSLTWFDPRDLSGRTTDLAEYDIAFTGLLQGGPMSTRVHLHRDWKSACRANAFWAVGNADCISYGAKLGGFEAPELALTSEFTYVFDANTDVTAWLPARLHARNPGMLISDSPAGAKSEWPLFLANMLLRHMNARRVLNFTGTSILSSANPQGAVRNTLIRHLREMDAHDFADQLSRNLFAIEIHKDNQGSLFEAPEGYKFSRTGEIGEMVSNFVLKFSSNVVFPENHDTYHAGELLVGDGRYPFLLSSRLPDNPKDLQQEMQRLAASHKTRTIPVIKSTQGWKMVANYLRQMPARLPTESGTPFLGWDFHKKSFFTPAWRYTMEGCAPAGKLHPGVMALDCFSGGAVPRNDLVETAWLKQLPVDVASLVSLVLGSILRGFQDRPCHVVAVRNDRLSGGWLARIFSGLGQSQALPRVERDMGGYLRGMPAYALAADKMTMTVKAPYFVIAEHGLRLTTQLDHPAWKWLPDLVSAMTRQTVEHALSLDEPTSYNRVPRITYEGEIRDEFSRMVRKDLELEWPEFLPEYANVEAFLASVSPDTIQRAMQYRFSTQQLCLDMKQLAGNIDRTSLAMELRALCRSCEIQDSVIEIDAHTGLQMLQQYYDQAVSLPHC